MKQQQTKASTLRALAEDTRGAGLVEYIILVGLIALLAMAGFSSFGSAVNTKAIGLGTQVSGIGGAPAAGAGN